MALTPTEQAAAERLTEYNGGRYDASSNPHGLAGEGYKTQIPAALNDTGVVAEAVGRLAEEASAAAAVVTPAIPIVTAARDQAVAAANTAAGIVQHVQPSEIGGIDPILDFPFSGSAAVPSGVITGSSGKWVTGPNGLLTFVPAGVAPIDYDPITGAVRGLLVEESRTNLLTYSAAFDNAAWSTDGVNVTANASVAPDGTMTMDTLTASSGGTQHNVYRFFTPTAARHTLSFFAKAGTTPYVVVQLFQSGVLGDFTSFNLSSGAVISGSGSIAPVGGGIYRCSLTSSVPFIASSASLRIGLAGSAGGLTFSAAGTETAHFWGTQLEAASFATSYIPTTSSAVTRAADVNTLLLFNVSGWNPNEVTLYLEFMRSRTPTATEDLILPYANGAADFVRLSMGTGGTITASARVNGSDVVTLNTATVTNNVFHRVAFSCKSGSWAVSLDGSAAATSSVNSFPPAPTAVTIGSFGGGNVANCWIRRLTIFPRALTSSTIQLLTA